MGDAPSPAVRLAGRAADALNRAQDGGPQGPLLVPAWPASLPAGPLCAHPCPASLTNSRIWGRTDMPGPHANAGQLWGS